MAENTEQNLQQSYATFGHRGPKTAENPYGWYNVQELDPDEPAVLIFGGQSTTTDRAASSYCKMVEEVLDRNGCKEGVNVIGVVNHYGDTYDAFLSRSAGVNNVQECDKEKLNEETLNPQYVNDIFEFAIKNRLSDKDGKRLDIKDATQKMRKLNIFVHCHGGNTFAQLEKLTWQKMKELGYSKEERTQVMQELMVVAYAPYTALGKSKAKMVSFVSDTDPVVTYNNRIEDTIRYQKDIKEEKTQTCFFEGALGNVFRAHSFGNIDQHELESLYPDEKKLNADGKNFMHMLRTAMVKGVKSSLSGEELGSIQDLVSHSELDRSYVDFLTQSGEKVWDNLTNIYRENTEQIMTYSQNFKKHKYFNEQEATAERMEYLKEQEQKNSALAKSPYANAPIASRYNINRSNELLRSRFLNSVMNWTQTIREMRKDEPKATRSLSSPALSKVTSRTVYRAN